MKFKDLVNIATKRFELLKQKSIVTHQYAHNIYESGSVIESDLRMHFNEILPSRFKATHGYIVSSDSIIEEPKISPQIDLIIVDTFVPHTLYKFGTSDSMEIIIKQSVVGVFEIKRSINKKSLLGTNRSKGAIQHLNDIIQSVGLDKTNSDRFLPGGLKCGRNMAGGLSPNPMFGIIGLDTTKGMSDITSQYSLKTYVRESIHKPHIDIVTCLGDFTYVPQIGNQAHIINQLPQDFGYIMFKKSNKNSKEYLMSTALGYILYYLNYSCGTIADVNNYYFSNSLF